MTKRYKLWLLSALGVAVLAITFLAAGLPGLEMRPGKGLSPQVLQQANPEDLRNLLADLLAPVRAEPSLWIMLLAVSPVVILILLLVFSPESRKHILRNLFRAALWTLALYLLLPRLKEILKNLKIPEMQGPPRSGLGLDVPSAFITNPPGWLAFLLSFTLLALIGGVAWYLWRRVSPPVTPLELLTLEARTALEDILAGMEVRNAILRCYYEMLDILNRQRGLQRQEWMTAREFELRLVEAGLPGKPVSQLTRLFEAVRYGARETGSQEEKLAVSCLSAIVQAGEELK